MSHSNGEFFCDNEQCALHVPHIPGHNWAQLPDGRMFSRARTGEKVYCDVCHADPCAPVRLELTPGEQS